MVRCVCVYTGTCVRGGRKNINSDTKGKEKRNSPY